MQGVSQLHWRRLFQDADLYCFTHGCWSDAGGPDKLRRSWAIAKFGSAAADFVVDGTQALEAFNDEVVRQTPDILHSAWWVGFECFMGGLLSANRFLDGVGPSEKFIEDAITPLLASAEVMDRHLSKAVAAFEKAVRSEMTSSQKTRLGYWLNRASYSRDLYRAHVKLARAVQLAAGTADPKRLRDALTEIESADAEGIVARFAERLGEGTVPDRGELGLLLSLNVKFVGSFKRIEAAVRRLLHPPKPEPAKGVLDVRAGALLPQIDYANYFQLLQVSASPWIPQNDLVFSEAGFSYQVVQGSVGRISPVESVWSDRERLIVEIRGPANWRGILDLYFYQEPDWDTPFRVQAIELNGHHIGQVQDFYGRGSYHDQGIWRFFEIAIPSSGILELAIVRLGGGDARLSRFIARPTDAHFGH